MLQQVTPVEVQQILDCTTPMDNTVWQKMGYQPERNDVLEA